MTYYRYSVLLAACLTFLGTSSSYGQSAGLNTEKSEYLERFAKSEQLGQVLWQTASDRANFDSVKSTVKSYLQQGYQANANKDYLSALANFQKALSLSPEDSVVKEAMSSVKRYVYDQYMHDGYEADRARDYQTALSLFLKAQSLRPDAFHAQQAVHNVSTYIAQAEQKDSEQQQNKNQTYLFLGIGLFVTVLVASAVLYSLLKSSAEFDEIDRATDDLDNAEYSSESVKELNRSNLKEISANNHKPAPQSNAKIEAVQAIEPTLTTPDTSLSIAAGDNNKSLAKVDIVTELIQDLNQSDPIQRRKVIWELAQRADSRAMKPLVELMIEADSQERSLILEALSQIAARALKPLNKAIAISLEDRNSQVRKNAIRDLTRVYELMSQVTTRLAQAAGDPDEEVQETAKWALQQLNQMPHISQEFLKIQQQSELNED
jgi:tetratricopeptide (TPR) repeat protein